MDKRALEERLAALRAEIARPEEGLFGPSSVVWRVNRESVVFLGAGRAALLQIAHPFVGHAVDEHSASRTDPWGRLLRTFDHVFTMVFADLDAAEQSARRVHAVHRHIEGTIDQDVGHLARGAPYRANQSDALAWVAATLWDTSLLVYESVVGPLGARDRDRYVDESRRFGALFGLLPSELPASASELEEYMARMLSPGSPIALDETARVLARDLMRPPSPALAPVWGLYRQATAMWLPAHLASGFGLGHDERARASQAAMIALARAARPLAPRSLRYLPAYQKACARLEDTSPSMATRALDRTWRWLVRGARTPRRRPQARSTR